MVVYGPQPLTRLNTETRHGFEEQYSSEKLLQSLANNFIFYYDDKRHRTNGNPVPDEVKEEDKDGYYQPIYDWKIVKDRQKTVAAALLLCLNLGVDPPDVTKTQPCARLEAWVDPLSFQDSKKAIEQIGKNLQSQYETLSLRTRYKQSLDPCVEDVKRFCNSLRRASKDERILFHYNGHGVPQPTPSGEIWVFNRGYTQYIPVSLYDLQTWLGAPCIYVWDCNSAGNIVSNFKKFVQKRIRDDKEGNHDVASPSPTESYTECVQLASCENNELLPMNPELPADFFTCCLTNPIEISVKVFLMQSPLKDTKYAPFFQNNDPRRKETGINEMPNITIPGKLSERRTPLGELNWIFTAITDTIAWTSLPRALFKKLFRHDLMVAALFRNFLLAKRIMPWYNCHPVSDPALPDSIADHPMWRSWDLAIDEVLTKLLEGSHSNSTNTTFADTQLSKAPSDVSENLDGMPNKSSLGNLSSMSLVNYNQASQNSGNSTSYPTAAQQQQQQFTKFFEQNLTAFDLWVKYGANSRHPPEQLPIVLQVLLSQVHRVRTLVLLSRFLDLGPWAVYLSLSIGIFPYVSKLLQSPSHELKPILVFIWARILSIDYKNTQTELIKERGYQYFVKMLVPEFGVPRAQSISSNGSPLTMNVPASSTTQRYQMYQHQQQQAYNNATLLSNNNTTDEQKAMAAFVLSCFVRDFPLGQRHCFSIELVNKLCFFIENSEVPLLRQWCIILIGQLFIHNPLHKTLCLENENMNTVVESLKDPIPEIRCAALLAIKYFLSEEDDVNIILKLQQEFQQQIQQFQAQLQLLQSQQNQQQQQGNQQNNTSHIQQQYYQIQQQLQNVQTSITQLQSINLRNLKQYEIKTIVTTLSLVNDGSPIVRKELIIFLSQVVERYIDFFTIIAFTEISSEIASLESNGHEDDVRNVSSVGHGSIFNTVWKALLILSEDPFPENKDLAQDVIDYILLKLNEHPKLGEIIKEMEQYILSRNAVNSKGLVSSNKLPTIRRPASLNNNKKDSVRNESPNDRRVFSMSALFKALGFSHEQESYSDNESIRSSGGRAAQGLSLMGIEYGTNPRAFPMMYKKRDTEVKLPLESRFLDYCSEYFQEPQMKKHEVDEPGSIEYTAREWKRNRNESIIQETQSEKELALYGDWSRKTVTFDNKTQPKILLFTQFDNYVTASDDRDNVTVYDWSTQEKLARFSNGNPFGTKITDMKFLNDDDTPLLLTGSSDGVVNIYKDFYDMEKLHMISSWRGLTDLLLTPRSTGLLTEWQQSRGSLLVTGDVKIIRIWDALTESIEVDIPAKSSALITSLTSDQLTGNIFVAGYSDGSIRVYDRRMDPRDSMIRLWKTAKRGTSPVGSWVNNIHLQRGGYRELVSGTNNGVVSLWDIRNDQPVCNFTDEGEPGKKSGSTMTSMQVHEHAPVIATGTKEIKIWTTSGDLLRTFKNHGYGHSNTISGMASGTRSSPFISALTFHPHRMMLAANNSHDTTFNIYECYDSRREYMYY